MKIDPKKKKGAAGRQKRVLLPEGTYLVDVSFVERKISAKKGTPFLAFTYVVKGGKQKNARIYDDAYLLDSTLWKIEAIVEALGITEEFDTDNQTSLLDTFCGNEMIVTTKHEVSEYVDKDGNDTESTKVVVSGYRATSETKEHIAKLKAEKGEQVEDDGDQEYSEPDNDDGLGDDETPF